MRKTAIVITTTLCFLLIWCKSFANPEIATLKSSLVWRPDGKGDYVFKGNGKINGAVISEDGTIECTVTTGTYELTVPYKTAGLVSTMAMNWSFEGKVTMELSAGADYVKVINGVPLGWGEFPTGSEIKWKAALTKGSKLKEVNIVYTDISGVQGNWGTPELSSFKFRKPVYLKGSESAELFNYQMPVTISESLDTADCDVYIKGITQSDFSDMRFTQADKQTLLSIWRESIAGEAGKRKAVFWIKIPQFPKEGLLIYLYYGKEKAVDLSDGKAVFDLFDDFSGLSLRGAEGDEAISSQIASLKAKSDARNDTVWEYKIKDSAEIKTLDKEKMTNEEIINFFSDSAKYDWIRVRQYIKQAPKPDIVKIKGVSEELPNLADFEGVVLTKNGDLALDEKYNQGKYSSITFDSDLPIRIMVASWKEQTSKDTAVKVNISAAGEEKTYKEGCVKDAYYYASKEDFKAGKTLKWEAVLSRKDSSVTSPSLNEFSLDYRPGTITLISPDGKEALSAASQHQISWSAWEYEPSYKMKLEYSIDAGANFSLIIESENTGRYTWTVPGVSSNQVLVKVSDSLNKDICDISNNVFSIGKDDSAQVKISKTEIKDMPAQGAAGETAVVTTANQSPAAKGRKQTTKGTKIPSAKQTEEQQEDSKQSALVEEESLDVSYLGPLIDNTKRQGTKPYDLLVMPHDNSSPDSAQDKSSYKRGDVVLAQPSGYKWSDNEKNSFLIIQVYLTPQEAEQLLIPEQINTGKIDEKTGEPIIENVANRAQRINVDKFGLKKTESGKKLRAVYEFLKNKPVMRGVIERK